MKKSIKLKVGLLGGSFNPAHLGHLHISEIARKKLGLAQVWWLVSPQNPLKSSADMMVFDLRFKLALAMAKKNPKIRVMDLESKFRTSYTLDTLKRLRQKYPDYDFQWIMGADNLVQLPRWKKWREIIRMVPVHVFDRDRYFYKAVQGLAYRQCKERIHYHLIRKNLLSSTQIRSLTKTR